MNAAPTIEELNARWYRQCRALGITPPIGEAGAPPALPCPERAA